MRVEWGENQEYVLGYVKFKMSVRYPKWIEETDRWVLGEKCRL